MRIKINVRKAQRAVSRFEAGAPSKTISSGRVGARTATTVKIPPVSRIKISKIPTRILPGRRIEPKIRPTAPIRPVPIIRVKTEDRTPAPKHRDFVNTRKLQRRGVPNPQSLTQAEYARKFGLARDVSTTQTTTAAPTGGVTILIGPTNLNHEGRLRKTGKPCGHWAMYAYLLDVGGKRVLGVQFRKGFRCYYPSTNESEYHAIVNAESGSYYSWDHLRKLPYMSF